MTSWMTFLIVRSEYESSRGDLAGVEPLGDEAQDGDLAVGEAREVQAARREHLALQPADLLESRPSRSDGIVPSPTLAAYGRLNRAGGVASARRSRPQRRPRRHSIRLRSSILVTTRTTRGQPLRWMVFITRTVSSSTSSATTRATSACRLVGRTRRSRSDPSARTRSPPLRSGPRHAGRGRSTRSWALPSTSSNNALILARGSFRALNEDLTGNFFCPLVFLDWACCSSEDRLIVSVHERFGDYSGYPSARSNRAEKSASSSRSQHGRDRRPVRFEVLGEAAQWASSSPPSSRSSRTPRVRSSSPSARRATLRPPPARSRSA